MPKPLKEDVLAHMDPQMAWNTCTVTIWLVHFAGGVGGKLTTFTVVNLTNISDTLITVALLFTLLCSCVPPWHSDALLATSGRRSENKGTDVGESSRCSASTVREP